MHATGLPEWRNGRRSRLKICRPQGHEGSSPPSGTTSRARGGKPPRGVLAEQAMKIRVQLSRRGALVGDELTVESDALPRIGEQIDTDFFHRSQFKIVKQTLVVVDVRYEHKGDRLEPLVVCVEHTEKRR